MNKALSRIDGVVVAIIAALLGSGGCAAADPDPGEAGNDVATGSSALVTAGWGYVRTPAVQNTTTYQAITCSDCASPAGAQWATIDKGDYLVKLPGLAPAASARWVVHVSPFGRTGVECAVNRGRMAISGNDLIVGVSCVDFNGDDTNTRFQLTYEARDAALPAPTDALGFASVVNNAFESWYASNIPAPTLQRHSTGKYQVSFSGLRPTAKGGNAQVSSWTKGRRCALVAWDASTDTGVKVHVECATTAGVPADTNFNVSYRQVSQADAGYVWFQNAGDIDREKPAPMWNKSYSTSDPALLSSGMEVKRVSAGRYLVDFRRDGLRRRNQFIELSAVGDFRNSCVLLNVDGDFAEIQCMRNGALGNSQFSLRVGDSEPLQSGWVLTSTLNLNDNFAVGHGVMCGQAALDLRQVVCVEPGGIGAVAGFLPVGPSQWPTTVKYVAIDNRDAMATRVLVLGTDNVLRATSGDLTLSFPTPTNFGTASEVAQPRFMPGNVPITFKKIVVVRESAANVVVGLTSDNRVVDLNGNAWVNSGYPVPANVSWKTISGTVGSLNLLATDGRMYRSFRLAAVATQLPALPGGLRAIGFGGDFVITNAGVNASGVVPCLQPKDAAGFYDCGTRDSRFYMFSDYGTWTRVLFGALQIPLTNTDAVLMNGNPLTQFPAVEDARLFHGDASHSLLTFHYNARVYHRTP
jgi:hypothetical protein